MTDPKTEQQGHPFEPDSRGQCVKCGLGMLAPQHQAEQQGQEWRVVAHEDTSHDSVPSKSWLLMDDSRPGDHIDKEVAQIWSEADAELIRDALQENADLKCQLQTLEKLRGCECVDPGSSKLANQSPEYMAAVERGLAGHVEGCEIGEYYRMERQLQAARQALELFNAAVEGGRTLTDCDGYGGSETLLGHYVPSHTEVEDAISAALDVL